MYLLVLQLRAHLAEGKPSKGVVSFIENYAINGATILALDDATVGYCRMFTNGMV
jgi:hypothetical protein